MARSPGKPANPYRRFTAVLLLLTSVIIAAITAFNIVYTFGNAPGSEKTLADAVEWQARSDGVIATQVWQTARLKNSQAAYALEKRGVDTLLLGSSSIMGIRGSMFPVERTVFNAAKNANPLGQVIAEAKYYIARYEQLRWVVVGFDWALGYPYIHAPVPVFDPGREVSGQAGIPAMVRDAISYQRVKTVLANIRNDMTGDDNPYPCPGEDRTGLDIFRPPFPGTCYGFRADGSATFSNYRGLSPGKWRSLLGTDGLRQYLASLNDSKGVANGEYLDGLAEIGKILEKRGGGLDIIIPAMMPGAVEFIEQQEAGAYLQKTMDDLSSLAAESRLGLLDASRAGSYGCIHREFLDPHHAFKECYEKIFSRLYP